MNIFEDWNFYDSMNTKLENLFVKLDPENKIQKKIKNIVESCLIDCQTTPLSSLPFLEPRVDQLYNFFKKEYDFKDIPDYLESLHDEYLELQMLVIYLQIAKKIKQKMGIPDESIGLKADEMKQPNNQ